MALDLNDPELEFADLVTAYQSWVMAVINDEKLGGETLLTDEIADDALNAMRFLPDVVTSAIETTLARVYDVDPTNSPPCSIRRTERRGGGRLRARHRGSGAGAAAVAA